MCQNCKCVVRRNTSEGGGSIETGREFRSASSKIYLKTTGWKDVENVGGREKNRRDNDVNRNRNVKRILDLFYYGNFKGGPIILVAFWVSAL